MKIFGTSKSPSHPQKKRKTFPAAVRDLAEKDGLNAKVIIYERAGMKGKYIDEMPILDAVEIAGEIEAALSREHGGGEYQLSLVNGDSELVESHQYSISGAPKGRERFGDDTGEFNRGMRGRGLSDELALRAFDAAIAHQASSGEELKTALGVMKELRAEDSGMKQVQIDFMNAAMQNALNPKNTTIEEHLRFVQMLKEVQPTLQTEDPMYAVIPSVIQLIGQLIQAKIGGGAQPNPAQLQQVQELLKSQGIDVNALLQQAGQAQLGAPGAAMGAVPKPGEATQPVQVQEVPREQREVTEQPDITGAMIDQLRLNIRGGASPKQIALQIIELVRTAEIWTPDNVAPILSGLVNQRDLVRLENELTRFFGAIPELSKNEELKSQIKLEFLKMLTEVDLEEQPDQEKEADEKQPGEKESPAEPPAASNK